MKKITFIGILAIFLSGQADAIEKKVVSGIDENSETWLVAFKKKTSCLAAKKIAFRHDFLTACEAIASPLRFYNFSYTGTAPIGDSLQKLKEEKSVQSVSASLNAKPQGQVF